MKQNKEKNIILHRINRSLDSFSFTEIEPDFSSSEPIFNLSLDSSYNIIWSKPETKQITVDGSLNIDFIKDDKLRGTEIYYEDGRIGIGRLPLFGYKFDISVPHDSLATALHIGDGKYGFSLGNGTNDGFIPEIIGLGSNENDPGLYLLGKTNSEISSNVPLVVMCGMNMKDPNIKNRPIFGVTSGSLNNYKFIVDQWGKTGIGKIPEKYKLEVNGTIEAKDIVLDGISFKSLIKVILKQAEEIDIMKRLLDPSTN